MQSDRRQRRGFSRAGAIPAEHLGLSGRRTRELALAQAWARAAGAALAGHAEVAVRRGVLEIVAADRAWFTALEPLAGRLAARVAAGCPESRIVRYRLSVRGVASAPAVSLPEDEEAGSAGAGSRPGGPEAGPAEPVTEERLRRLAARYAERQKP